MYSLIIAEDEEIFRNVLPCIIDWNSIGFEIVKVVDNGYKVLEALETTKVDAILTDIRMPVLNGLDLAMEVRIRYPDIKVILLSAFNEFDYVRKGLDYGIYGYILKADGEDEIVKYFTKLKKVLDQEGLKNVENEKLFEERSDYFKKLVDGKISSEENFYKEGSLLKLFFTYNRYQISLFVLDQYKLLMSKLEIDEVKRINKFIMEYLFKTIEVQHKGYILSINYTVYVIWTCSEKDYNDNLEKVYNNLNCELSLLNKNSEVCVTVSCITGKPVNTSSNIGASYNSAKYALMHKVYLGNNCIINEMSLPKIIIKIYPFAETEKIINDLLVTINKENLQNVIMYLEDIEKKFISCKIIDVEPVIDFGIKVVLAVTNELKKMRLNSDEMLVIAKHIVRQINYCETINDIFEQLKIFSIETTATLNNNDKVETKKIVDEAIKYMQQNYSKEISLKIVAKHVNVHPVHLSRLFSKTLGKTFCSILTSIRLKAAKKLLADINYKVYEISLMVGYQNPRYFSQLFISKTGLTPIEYREKYKNTL